MHVTLADKAAPEVGSASRSLQCAAFTLTFFPTLQCATPVLSPGSLHWLCLLPGMLYPQVFIKPMLSPHPGPSVNGTSVERQSPVFLVKLPPRPLITLSHHIIFTYNYLRYLFVYLFIVVLPPTMMELPEAGARAALLSTDCTSCIKVSAPKKWGRGRVSICCLTCFIVSFSSNE